MEPTFKKLAAFIAGLFIVCTAAGAQTGSPPERTPGEHTDSIHHSLASLDGVDKLIALESLIEITFHSGDERAGGYVDMLYNEAARQKEYKHMIFAMLKQVQLLLGEGRLEEAINRIQEAERASVERNEYAYMSYILSTLTELYLFADDNDMAMVTARKMYDEVKSLGNLPEDMYEAVYMIGSIYERMGMPYDALEYFNRAFEYNEEANRIYTRSYYGYYHKRNADLYKMITLAYGNIPDHENTIRYTDSLMVSINRSIEIEGLEMESFIPDIFEAEHHYAYAYIALGDTVKGMEHILAAQSLADMAARHLDGVGDDMNTLYCAYYEATGDYARALGYCDKMIEYVMGIGLENGLIARLKIKARLHESAGDYKSASEAYCQCIGLHEESGSEKYERQLHELRVIYELDKAEMQAEQDRIRLRSARNLILGLAGILVLAIVIVLIMIINRRRLKAKNKMLFSQIENRDELSQEVEKWKAEAMKMRSLAAVPSGGEDCEEPEEEFYMRLKELMSDPEVYTDNELTRKSLAEKLGTNERYLFDMIKKYFGMGFTEYITALRLDHARVMLSDLSVNHTIEAVAIDSGFGSRITFHRLFKSRYGLTPDEFRNMVKEKPRPKSA